MSSKQQEHGRRWEQYIRQECDDLRRAGLAVVRKNWRAPKVPRDGVEARIEPSKPDFSGALRGGRHVVFEAKATLSGSSLDFSRIAEHQWDHLDQADAAGAVTFVYICDGRQRKWVVPWWRILEADEERNSYPFGTYPVEEKRTGETWLDTLVRLEQVKEAA